MPRRTDERAISAALALSVLVHLALLLRLPQPNLSTSELTQRGDMPDSLSVQLAPLPPPAPPRVAREARPAPPPPSPPSKAAPPSKPPVLALRERPPGAPAAPRLPAPPQKSAPAPSAPAADLASYIEARRRARGDTGAAESAPSTAPSTAAASANEQATRLAAANLAAGRNLTFGYDPRRSGGVFTVTTRSYDYAEFVFYGWNRNVQRHTSQLIPVYKGDAPDIRQAIVRKMIGIIREYEQEDFVWESKRLGRNVTLSARPRDTAGLEDFLLREFFDDWRRP